MNKYFLIGIGLMLSGFLKAQGLNSLSLEEAYSMLEKQYPTLQNGDLLEQIHEREQRKIDIAQKPRLNLKGEGRLQTESVQLDSEGAMLPFEIDQPIYSLKTYAEAQYTLLDGGIFDAQSRLKDAQLKTDLQNIELDRFALRERINQLFIGISLLEEQAKLLDISLKDLETRKESVAAGVQYGTILESELTKIEVKQLELQAQQANLAFKEQGLLNSLSYLIGQDLSTEVKLNFPQLPNAKDIPSLNRPEQSLFQLQREAILAQSNLIEADKKPQLVAFAQAGFGYPNPLNLLDSGFAPYGVLGAQFNWKITDWKKRSVEKEILSLQVQQVENAQKTFEFNMNSKTASYLAEVDRLNSLLEQDEKIAQLQAQILEQLAVQLDEGVLTSADYLIQVNAELKARQNLLIHQTELLQAQLEFWNDRGGF